MANYVNNTKYKVKSPGIQHQAMAMGAARNVPEGLSPSVLIDLANRNRGIYEAGEPDQDDKVNKRGMISAEGMDKYGITPSVRKVVGQKNLG